MTDKAVALHSPAQAPAVIHGPNEFSSCGLVGKTVGWVREALVHVLNVPSTALPVVNGAVQDEAYLLAQDDRLIFLSDLGVKGLGRLLTPAQLVEEWRINDKQYQELLRQGLPSIRFDDGGTLHPEVAVDAWTLHRAGLVPSPASLTDEVRRIADHFDPPPPDKVGSGYVAERLGCTNTWVADLARRGEIPKACVVAGTGDGKPWKFYRAQIDEWIGSR